MTSNEHMPRPVIVTGASGFVGSHVLRAVVASGRTVVATDLSTDPPEHALVGLETSHLTYIPGDITATTTLDALAKATDGTTDVIHVAALIQMAQLGSSLGESAPTPAAALRSLEVNAMASWRLCTSLVEANRLGRFVHVSTRSVFGGRPSTRSNIDEQAPPQPAGVYGASKAAAEHGLLALRAQFDVDLVIARITGVFGPWQGPVSWIGQAMDAAIAGRPYRAATGGDDAYELTYVKDTVRGIMMLLDAQHLASDVYHVASGARLTKLSEVEIALRQADPAADVSFGDGTHEAARGRSVLGTTVIRNELGFVPTWSLDAAIADYLAIERSGDYGPEADNDRRVAG